MIDQLAIGICGATSVWLSQSPNAKTQRYACLFGLVAQPFWFYATYIAEQWGMFLLAFVYTFGWARGVRTYWLKKRGT